MTDDWWFWQREGLCGGKGGPGWLHWREGGPDLRVGAGLLQTLHSTVWPLAGSRLTRRKLHILPQNQSRNFKSTEMETRVHGKGDYLGMHFIGFSLYN